MALLEHYIEQLDYLNWNAPVDNEGQAYGITNPWDRKFISEVAWHVRNLKGSLTTSQVEVAAKLIDRYRINLQLIGEVDYEISSVIEHRATRQPVRNSSTTPREVRWIGDSKLAFRFKFNPQIKDHLKRLKSTEAVRPSSPSFDPQSKAWIVQVTSSNVGSVMGFVTEYGFGFDDEVVEFFTEVTNAKKQKSSASIDNDVISIEVKDDHVIHALMKKFKEIHDV